MLQSIKVTNTHRYTIKQYIFFFTNATNVVYDFRNQMNEFTFVNIN